MQPTISAVAALGSEDEPPASVSLWASSHRLPARTNLEKRAKSTAAHHHSSRLHHRQDDYCGCTLRVRPLTAACHAAHRQCEPVRQRLRPKP